MVSYLEPDLSDSYYKCVTVEGLVELIKDKIKKDKI